MGATWLKRLSVASRGSPLSICPNIACPATPSFISWLPLSLTNSTPSNQITPFFLIAHRLSRRGKTRYWGYVTELDVQLMCRVRDGDIYAFSLLVERYRKPLISF